jgi:hypothetical protein
VSETSQSARQLRPRLAWFPPAPEIDYRCPPTPQLWCQPQLAAAGWLTCPLASQADRDREERLTDKLAGFAPAQGSSPRGAPPTTKVSQRASARSPPAPLGAAAAAAARPLALLPPWCRPWCPSVLGHGRAPSTSPTPRALDVLAAALRLSVDRWVVR